MSEGRKSEKGKNLPSTAFKPGVSGNPGGQPKWVREMRDLCGKHSPEAIQTLVELMQTSPKDEVRKAAADSILDRAGLKAFCVEPDNHAFTDASGNPINSFVVRLVKPDGTNG